jgi:hypothetical protein
MPTKTLYVADEDAGVWEEAKALSAGNDESLSRMVTDALRLSMRQQLGDSAGDQERESGVSVTIPPSEYTTLINRYRRDLRGHGWKRVSLAVTRAYMKEGVVESRSAAARKANETRGPEGRRAAALKAHATMKARKRSVR